ncbi:LuxR C-terminal-related transcriptional regulator [Embleya sp. NPDC005575]|uniref:helix-turn-helix transcriptional regulator n=1 Tax=Embleya sp. NPDC005575 TaxID=3156892 RepID=UPI0033A72FFF
MLIGVALLGLLSDLACRQPLLLVIDDAQCIDRASLDALAFAVKRLDAEPVTLLIGVRTGDPLPALDRHWPVLTLDPLDTAAAGRLLEHQPQSPTGRARDRVLDQAGATPWPWSNWPGPPPHPAATPPGHCRFPSNRSGARRLGDDASPRLRALISRARALLADPEDAEPHFREALADPALEHWPFERAQTLLDCAEWLRRRRRIAEARSLLTAALETFQRLGARPWVERARAESRAAGIDVAHPSSDAPAELSPQQRQIIRLAARGLTNREIGEKLFLSPRTVGSHLYRSFPKLGITARSQLRDLIEGTLVTTSGQPG